MTSQLDIDIQEFIRAGMLQPIDPVTGLFALHGRGEHVLLWIDDNKISWHGEDSDKPPAEVTNETAWMISEKFQRYVSLLPPSSSLSAS